MKSSVVYVPAGSSFSQRCPSGLWQFGCLLAVGAGGSVVTAVLEVEDGFAAIDGPWAPPHARRTATNRIWAATRPRVILKSASPIMARQTLAGARSL